MDGSKLVYTQKQEARLKELYSQLRMVEEEAAGGDEGDRARFSERLEALRKKHETARRKVEEFSAAGEDAWEDLTEGVEESIQNLRSALRAAGSKPDRE